MTEAEDQPLGRDDPLLLEPRLERVLFYRTADGRRVEPRDDLELGQPVYQPFIVYWGSASGAGGQAKQTAVCLECRRSHLR